jgi:hypothetical protein
MQVYNKVQSGEIAGSATAKQLPDISCRLVYFVAPNTNAGDVYIGGAGVTVPDGNQDATSGYELKASAQSPGFQVSNLNLLYIICDNAGDDLVYIALG